ncbi:MAG: hypothetical protein G01um101418_650 [Parcubacteria group bacterium Gr01-1014_18]|nr:MAG: hypothetical protein Greene041636_639 [Parcubacteria group bacterium Greene0416_36]TSC80731.1 MAG: hypothetical protein G01um101418_650 [Parcubacteria group bacterium Gr01-1014_18]TSC98658.1 MAG: hypothetical protein Greene101420_617 [Parcubacteria group bacterium Greene1014_20]TSD07182.1 MAG: hypothetical protein Greene07142_351 [Parcubacteria group bacterium Greene0714_2]
MARQKNDSSSAVATEPIPVVETVADSAASAEKGKKKEKKGSSPVSYGTKYITILEITIQTTSPLLGDPMTPEKLLEIDSADKKVKVKGLPGIEIARKKVWIDPDSGKSGVPAKWIYAATRCGGCDVDLGNRKKVSTKTSGSIIGSFFRILGYTAEFVDQEMCIVGKEKFRVNEDRGVIPKAEITCRIVRPEYPEGTQIKFLCEVKDRLGPKTIDIALQCLKNGGVIYGIGSYRVNCNGTNGTFKIVRVQEVKKELLKEDDYEYISLPYKMEEEEVKEGVSLPANSGKT